MSLQLFCFPPQRIIILFSGVTSLPEKCERGLDLQLTRFFFSLQELVPITETMTIPFDYHRFIIGAKGANVRQMMDEFDVNITIPPSRDESDQVVIVGTRPKVNKAIEALEQKVAEIEAENEDRVSFGSSLQGPFII